MERVVVYIDGFNLYFGLMAKGWRRYLWLNLQELSRQLLKPGQVLLCVKYFTARVKHNPDKQKRQNVYLEALSTLNDFHIYYGKFLVNTQRCPKCSNTWPLPSEKMTDVNIAVELLTDAFQNKFDTAILVSADSDLVGPLRAVKELFSNKKIIAAFPPKRSSWDLQQVADAYFTIGQNKFKNSQFPETIKKPDEFELKRPTSWI